VTNRPSGPDPRAFNISEELTDFQLWQLWSATVEIELGSSSSVARGQGAWTLIPAPYNVELIVRLKDSKVTLDGEVCQQPDHPSQGGTRFCRLISLQ
jgi:hypothetical protein